MSRSGALPAGTSHPVIDAKGDLLAGASADTLMRLAAGADGGLLTPDSASPSGLAWMGAPFINVKAPPYKAAGNNAGDDTAAIRQALTDAPGGGGGLGAIIYIPHGQYIVDPVTNGPLPSKDNHLLLGEGRLSTWLRLKSGANAPIFDSATLMRWNLRGIGFTVQSKASHAGNVFPLVRCAPYLGDWADVYFYNGPGDGAELSGGGDRMRLFHVHAHSCRYGLYLKDTIFTKLYGGSHENNEIGVFVERTGANAISGGSIQADFEENTRYSVYFKGASGWALTNSYIFNSPVGLDEDSNNNWVQNNTLNNARIYDGGRGNITTPNHGEPRRPQDGKPLSVFFPASLVIDPDLANRSSTFWTAIGGGSFTRQDPDNDTRMRDRTGRVPLRITGAAGKGGSQVISALVAGETYLVEIFWHSGLSGGVASRGQVQILDNTSSAVLFDSGPVTRPDGPVTTEWRDAMYRTVFQVPVGTTAIKLQVTTPDAGTLVLGRANFIRLAATNGGMEGAYAAGVAPDWTQQAGSTGTPTEETTIVKTGAKAQRLAVAAGQKITLGQVIVPNKNSLYLARAAIQVVAGSPGRAVFGWGNADLSNSADYQIRASARRVGEWESVMFVVRPSSWTRLLFGLTSDAGEAADAIFDDITFLPLKDSDASQILTSAEFTLSAAGATTCLLVPQVDCQLKRVSVVYTTATDANAGTAIRVGTPASTTYYASLTSEVSKAIGDQTELSLSHTDIRAGTPVMLQNAGAKVGVGKYVVVLEITAPS